MNKQLDFLTEYPFQYLSDLLKDIKKDPLDVVGLHIGEPKERAPIQALDIINENSSSYSKYPTSSGELYLRESYCNYLNERFSISNINPDIHVLPLSGSREGIFSFIQSTIDSTKKNNIERNIKSQFEPHVCGPNCEHEAPSLISPISKQKTKVQSYNGPRSWVIEHSI